MENQAKDAAKALRNRFMGKAEKFLEKRRQQSPVAEDDTQQDVNTFLHGPSDKLYMTPPSNNGGQGPAVARTDASNPSRWPTMTEINDGQRARSTSPRVRRGRKGLHVHFLEAQPEVIGVGGDECTMPVTDIGARKRAYSHPPSGSHHPLANLHQSQSSQLPYPLDSHEHSSPMPPPLPLRPMPSSQQQPQQDGVFGALPDIPPPAYPGPPLLPEIKTDGAAFMSESSEDTSLTAKIQKMRAGEGKALLRAASQSSAIDQHFPRAESPLPINEELSTELEELHNNTLQNAQITSSQIEAPLLKEPTPPRPPKEYSTSVEVVSPIESSHRSISPPDRNAAVSPPLSEHTPTSSPSVAAFIPRKVMAPIQASQTPQSTTTQGIPPLLEVRKPSPLRTPDHSRDSLTRTPQPVLEHHNLIANARPTSSASTNSYNLHESSNVTEDEALQDFSRRSAHLYTLFRLSAESVKPLPKCSPQELVRVALWWFLRGRSDLETSMRERSSTPETQQANLLSRQQAHADLAKALWIIENVTSQYPQRQTVSTGPNTPMADLLSAQSTMLSSLRKLAISMKRNNILPPDPDDAPLPQGVDNTIWKADDGDRSLVFGQRFNSTLSLLESFSLGDTEHHFQYGRMFVEAVLLEEAQSKYYRAHVLLSVLRSQREKGLTITAASQDGLINIAIQDDSSRGPTWKDVSWQHKSYSLTVKMTRGFMLQLHCQQQDYEALWNLYDLHTEIYAVLHARESEELIFDTTVKMFQQFNLGENGESVPAPPLPNCYLRVFQRNLIGKSTSGLRKSHRGFRIGLCTNVKTKNVKGVDRVLLPNFPIQFGYLRGDGGFPALLLKSSDENSQNNIVFTFADVNQRTRLHTLLTGLAVMNGEEVVSQTAVKGFTVTNEKNYDAKCLKYLDWKSVTLINEAQEPNTENRTINSNNLRLVLDFKAGTITDRINVGPGELKIRLDVNNSTQLKILRQPQQDLTVAFSESQVLKELPNELTDMLRIMGRYETTRTYTFGDIHQLHIFQNAITGYKPLFDGIAASFSISRRRMVVPIYKKWEATTARIQLIEKDRAVQLVAFFEGFNHGSCMNFALKSTDVFETSGKSGKFTVKFVDAKFALPKAKDANTLNVEHDFVNFDIIDFATEHDDVSIVFDAEADRDRFTQYLPAQVKHASRLPFGK